MSDHGTDVPPIDTAKFRSHCQDWLGFNEYAVDECFALCDEVDRLRGLLARGLDAIEAIWGDHICDCHRGHCFDCASPWPCPTEQAHIAAEEIRKALGEGT